jgi:hypothetical protein
MKPDLYQRISVNRDVPKENIKRGDAAWLIDDIEPLRADQILSVRSLAS